MSSTPWPEYTKSKAVDYFRSFRWPCQICEDLFCEELQRAWLPVCSAEHQQLAAQDVSKYDEASQAGGSAPVTAAHFHGVPYSAQSTLRSVPGGYFANSSATLVQGAQSSGFTGTHTEQNAGNKAEEHAPRKRTATQSRDRDLSRQTSRSSATLLSEEATACPSCLASYGNHKSFYNHLRGWCYSHIVWICLVCGHCSRTQRAAKEHRAVNSSNCQAYERVTLPYSRQAFGCRHCYHNGGPFYSIPEFSRHLRSQECAGKHDSGKGHSSLEMHDLLRQEAFKSKAEHYIRFKHGAVYGIDSLWWGESAWLADQISRLEFGMPKVQHEKYNCGIRSGELERTIIAIVSNASLRVNADLSPMTSFPGTPVSSLGGMTLQAQTYAPTNTSVTLGSGQLEIGVQPGQHSMSSGKGKLGGITSTDADGNRMHSGSVAPSSNPQQQVPCSVDLGLTFYENHGRGIIDFDDAAWAPFLTDSTYIHLDDNDFDQASGSPTQKKPL